jgi:hypothetical protein
MVFLVSPARAAWAGPYADYAGTSSTEKDGFPSAFVRVIAQDRDGYLWVGTTSGVARFDGARFVQGEALSEPALEAEVVKGLCGSRDGSVWVGFRSGKDRTFRFFEHPVHLAQERALEGKYLIQTEEPNLSPVEAVTIYKDLSEVERAFAELKDVIQMRPIYHHKADRVRAHIFVASLAFLLDRALEKKLKASGLDLSSKEAWQLLKTVRVVEIDLGQGQRQRSVTQGSARAAHMLKAIGITNLDPDSATTGPEKAA